MGSAGRIPHPGICDPGISVVTFRYEVERILLPTKARFPTHGELLSTTLVIGTDMLIVVKIFLVAFAVFGQAKLFPERPHQASGTVESRLDSLVLPEDKPESVLAQRAMQEQGLCPATEAASGNPKIKTFPYGWDTASAADQNDEAKHGLATNCF